tara:strand:+ start:82 stop:255 length:174 start_codon:yes stop_codon:yes gene_type:complete
VNKRRHYDCVDRTVKTFFKAFVVNLSPARSAGFEPATGGLEDRCSIQLSYERNANGS